MGSCQRNGSGHQIEQLAAFHVREVCAFWQHVVDPLHVAHIQGCGDVQHEALEAETEKEEHHGEDDVPQLGPFVGLEAFVSQCLPGQPPWIY